MRGLEQNLEISSDNAQSNKKYRNTGSKVLESNK